MDLQVLIALCEQRCLHLLGALCQTPCGHKQPYLFDLLALVSGARWYTQRHHIFDRDQVLMTFVRLYVLHNGGMLVSGLPLRRRT